MDVFTFPVRGVSVSMGELVRGNQPPPAPTLRDKGADGQQGHGNRRPGRPGQPRRDHSCGELEQHQQDRGPARHRDDHVGLVPRVEKSVGRPIRATTDTAASSHEWPARAQGVATHATSSVAKRRADAARSSGRPEVVSPPATSVTCGRSHGARPAARGLGRHRRTTASRPGRDSYPKRAPGRPSGRSLYRRSRSGRQQVCGVRGTVRWVV